MCSKKIPWIAAQRLRNITCIRSWVVLVFVYACFLCRWRKWSLNTRFPGHITHVRSDTISLPLHNLNTTYDIVIWTGVLTFIYIRICMYISGLEMSITVEGWTMNVPPTRRTFLSHKIFDHDHWSVDDGGPTLLKHHTTVCTWKRLLKVRSCD